MVNEVETKCSILGRSKLAFRNVVRNGHLKPPHKDGVFRRMTATLEWPPIMVKS